MHMKSTIEGMAHATEENPGREAVDPGTPSGEPAAMAHASCGPGHWQLGESYGNVLESPSGDLGQTSLWAIPWSDLMMVMFVLFASLLIMQRHQGTPEPVEVTVPDTVVVSHPEPELIVEVEERDVERPTDVPRRGPLLEPPTQLDVLGQSEAAVREAGIDNVEVALTSNQSVKVSVQGPMFFELGKAELLPAVRAFLDRLADVIAGTPFDIDVIGHTDDNPVSTGEFPSNWELSVVRAARVARYLIDRSGIDPARFTAIGRSMYEPAAPNLDDHTRAMNRRVEIIITRRQSTISE